MEGNGTTFVHMDKSGAVNVMLHSQPTGEGQVLGAHWDIWPPTSIFSLSKALEPLSSDEDCRLAQPIISERHYVSQKASEVAFQNSGVSGWYTTQLPGEAVIIPPGCPHQVSVDQCTYPHVLSFFRQVSNHSNCLKIAVDFVSPSHIPVLEMLQDSFRMMNRAEGRMVHSDLLQLDTMLWYAWKSSTL